MWNSPEWLSQAKVLLELLVVVTAGLLFVFAVRLNVLKKHKASNIQPQTNWDSPGWLGDASIVLTGITVLASALILVAEARLTKLNEPRSFTRGSEAELVRLLSSSPKGTVDEMVVASDEEAFKFALQLQHALRKSGWAVNGGGPMNELFGEEAIGLLVIVHSQQTAPPSAFALVRALAAVGLSPTPSVDPKRPPGSLEILVGHKR